MANIEPADASRDLESEDQSFDQSADSDDLGVQRPEQKVVRAESVLVVTPTIQNVLEDSNTYNQLMESERKKSLSIAFSRLQHSSYTGGKQPSKEKDSLRVPAQTKSVSSRNSRSRRKSSTNSKGSGEESDDFKSLDNSFDNYQKDVRSAYEEVFHSFHGKSRPLDN